MTRDVLLGVLAVVLVVSPYLLITVGVYMITGILGWALIALGALILISVGAVLFARS